MNTRNDSDRKPTSDLRILTDDEIDLVNGGLFGIFIALFAFVPLVGSALAAGITEMVRAWREL